MAEAVIAMALLLTVSGIAAGTLRMSVSVVEKAGNILETERAVSEILAMLDKGLSPGELPRTVRGVYKISAESAGNGIVRITIEGNGVTRRIYRSAD